MIVFYGKDSSNSGIILLLGECGRESLVSRCCVGALTFIFFNRSQVIIQSLKRRLSTLINSFLNNLTNSKNSDIFKELRIGSNLRFGYFYIFWGGSESKRGNDQNSSKSKLHFVQMIFIFIYWESCEEVFITKGSENCLFG
mgnify:CR=1 FL=1